MTRVRQRALAVLALFALLGCQTEQQAVRSTAVPAAVATSSVAISTSTSATPVVVAAQPTPEPMADGIINLAHLNFLSELVQIDGEPQLLTHIYAEAPSYAWVDASGEGIAALDDVARAVIVYLDFYAATGNQRALERARAGLNFTLRMHADNGEFFNFILDRSGTINTNGATSYQSLGWWAYRGMWALARGYAIFKDIDPEYANQLQNAYRATEQAIGARLANLGQHSSVHGFDLPAWIPNGAADATGVAVLALAEYQATMPNPETERILTALADGLRDYQLGGPGEYPWGMHPHTLNAPGFWHAWGAHESQALARAGEVLGRDDYIESAKRELDNFFAWQLATERIQEMGALPFRQGQQAYGTNSIVQAAMNVYRATGDLRYATMGGLHASWFMGNNMANTPMYDPATGRGYDGIDRELAVNKNAGAESTIEALMALQAVVPVPEAAKYLDYQPVAQHGWQVFEAEAAREVAGDPRYGSRGWTGEARFSGDRFYELDGDDAVELMIDVPADDAYLLYVAHMRRAASQSERTVQAPHASAVITVDGQADEWDDVPVIASDTTAQIVRGAEGWRGAAVDSFTLQTQWDEGNLYVLAAVRDPEHEQVGQGPAVGSGDALWLYLDVEGRGQRIADKLTLAHTPAGPEVWDWRVGFPLPNAALAWNATDGGYVYEAALPWESLRARGVQAGTEMRIEAGRGFGGNSFMNLSGADPDSAANLVPLLLLDGASTPEVTQSSASSEPLAADSLALSVQFNGGETWTLPQVVSPDRDYLWLDLLTPQPVSLTQGTHMLRFSYAGSAPEGTTIVDGVLLHPAVATKTLRGPEGAEVRLSFDMLQGTLTIAE